MRTIEASAPIRVCDLGGWTDTWFAGHGAVLHLAVTPRVHVHVDAKPGPQRVDLHVVDYGDDVAVRPGDAARTPRHPLLEAAIDEVGLEDGTTLDVTVHSEAPAGCSTGTSAAVAVALVGALTAARRRPVHPLEVARTAHRLETDRLGLQSGIQDQLASAFGGVNLVEMSAYPDATVTPLALGDDLLARIEQRLVVVFLGRRHDSSAVHEKVIAELTGEGPDSPRLEALRRCAHRGRDTLQSHDLEAFGRVMIDNTDAQAALHPDLVGAEAQQAIAVAQRNQAIGWKVNGAGGEGGSLTLLLRHPDDRPAVEADLRATNPSFAMLPSTLAAEGLTVAVSGPASTRPST